ncbi:MAG: hypothetical protein JW715_12755 [Sedimentisphaerales bacterium]|nr:hypothetical protein [Sedimentisphaerales bacterium]
MQKHKAGLHKDVARIFDGVWIPQIDNIQQSFGSSPPDAAVYVNPKPTALENWSKDGNKTSPAKASKRNSWNLFSPKARKEKKRLSSISKNLLINLHD